MNEDEPFLRRWSRRKAQAKDTAAPSPDSPPPAEEALAPAAEDARVGDPPPETKRELTEADFADVDFDALDYNSDYGRFTAKGVPDSIKRKALQKLWTTDPIFTASDPFQDYQGDYTDAAVGVPAGTLKTSYRIGRGFMTDEDVAAWERLGKPTEESAVASPASPGPAAVVAVAAESADQPEVHALLRQSDAYMAGLYPAESNHLVDVSVLTSARARFLVARRDGTAVGCGALLLGADGEGEIKRMFVAPEARGGVGRQILGALEAAAKAEGVRVIRLETGVRQPEALALYRRCGYTERGPFASYEADPLSTFFEKWIA